MVRPCLLALAACSIPASPAIAAPPDPGPGSLSERIARFDETLDAANRISGVLRVSRGDSLLVESSFGFANVELGVRNAPETRFCIASITKEMTRLVAWQLLVEGRMGLGDTLDEFVPSFPRGSEITVEHLMRHRAGIPHRVTTSEETSRPLTPEAMTQRAMLHPLIVTPGSESVYSSAGYTVLARVIEIVEGRPFAEVLEARVFGPAGMTSAFDGDFRSVLPGRAASYMPGEDGLLNAPLVDLSFLAGAGSVFCTAADLERFFRAYRAGAFGDAAWGSLQRDGGISWLGATNGFQAFLVFDPESDMLSVFTGNTFGGGPGQLREALPRLVRGESVAGRPRPTAEVVPDPARLYEYVGEYETRPGATLPVAVRDGRLMIADSVVVPLSDTRFYFQNWSQPLEFVRDAAGAWTLTSTDADGTLRTWPRVAGERHR